LAQPKGVERQQTRMEDEYRIDAPEHPVRQTEERVDDERDVADHGDDPQRDDRLHEERREHEKRGKPSSNHDPHFTPRFQFAWPRDRQGRLEHSNAARTFRRGLTTRSPRFAPHTRSVTGGSLYCTATPAGSPTPLASGRYARPPAAGRPVGSGVDRGAKESCP